MSSRMSCATDWKASCAVAAASTAPSPLQPQLHMAEGGTRDSLKGLRHGPGCGDLVRGEEPPQERWRQVGHATERQAGRHGLGCCPGTESCHAAATRAVMKLRMERTEHQAAN